MKDGERTPGTFKEVPVQAGRVALEVYNPTGVTQMADLHAPRLASLAGKTICELGDGIWEDHRILTRIRELLQKRFADAEFLPFNEFPHGYEIDDDTVAEMVKERGCDGVVIASAG